MKYYAVVTDNIGETLARLHGRVSKFNRCRLRGNLLDGRPVQVVHINHLDIKLRGMEISDWEAHGALTETQIAFIKTRIRP